MAKNTTPKHINDNLQSIADATRIPSATETIKALKIDMQMAYIDADAYIANPYALLGQVLQIRKQNGKCPAIISDGGFSAELTPYPVKHTVDENSKLVKPVLRQSVIVDQKLASSVSFLSYLSAELNAESSFSLIVFDQASGLINTQDETWRTNLEQWKKDNQDLMTDPEICYLFAVVGFIQKNIVRKKYVKYSGKAKGGAFGVNINGELSTSTDDYSLDVKFGLSPIIIRRPPATGGGTMSLAKKTIPTDPSNAELAIFSAIIGTSLEKLGKLTLKTPAQTGAVSKEMANKSAKAPVKKAAINPKKTNTKTKRTPAKGRRN